MSAANETRPCWNCGGRCDWNGDAWVCTDCGVGWNEDAGLRYASPWTVADEERVGVLRRAGNFGAEYRRLRQLETLEAARRRGRS